MGACVAKFSGLCLFRGVSSSGTELVPRRLATVAHPVVTRYRMDASFFCGTEYSTLRAGSALACQVHFNVARLDMRHALRLRGLRALPLDPP